MEGQQVVVAGRTFVPVEHTTFEQDLFIMDHVRESGIDKIPIDITDEAAMSEAAEHVIMTAFRTGRLFLIVAGILVEEGKRWDAVEAELTAEFFATLTDLADKKALQNTLVAVILSFFTDEEGSFVISQKSSEPSLQEEQSGTESTGEPESSVSSTAS